MQRRRIAGIFFAVTFLAFLLLLVVAIFQPLFANMRIAIDTATTGSNEAFHQISLQKILTYFGVALLVYIANLVDVTLSHRRQLMAWREEQQGGFPNPPPL
jgi:hypothetical protein